MSQLLLGEGIKFEDNAGGWLDITTAIAWQAATFVKPDTSRGGSMDPGHYVKVKCIASGTPSESTLVKGGVCMKNAKHKRMTSQYKNPRLLLLGNDHLKMIIEKIEALRPNVLLVEKSASSYAREYLLAKEISLVLDVKRPLLEHIARCTGALVCPSIDNLSTTQLGHCELFRLEKVSEEHEMANQFHKKPSKTLMFFEGCPRRLCCTVLLRGRSREELKKVKHVVQYAIFAAYHLSLETSFLADEGATLPKMKVKCSISVPEKMQADDTVSIPNSYSTSSLDATVNASAQNDVSLSFNPAQGGMESLSEQCNQSHFFPSPGGSILDLYNDDLPPGAGFDMDAELFRDSKLSTMLPSDIRDFPGSELQETMAEEESRLGGIQELVKSEKFEEDGASSKYFSANDKHQSILVPFSSRCVLKGTVCECARLLQIKFYGSFDKPLGRYLRDDLFDQASCCRSCHEPADAHVICYTHQQGNLTINVRRLSSLKLPGEQDGKIWMWHRCLKCVHINGVPPVTRRVVMSDAAWGLSFGKFLELSFSNHATATRVATCGHSLQRHCLRFYGFGNMVAFFRYSLIDILSLMVKMEMLYSEGLLQPAVMETSQPGLEAVDIPELNRLRRSLLSRLYAWDRQLHSLDTIIKKGSTVKVEVDHSYDGKLGVNEQNAYRSTVSLEPSKNYIHSEKNSVVSNLEPVVPKDFELVVYDQKIEEDTQSDGNNTSPASALSERIDSAWTCTDLLTLKVQTPEAFQEDEVHPSLIGQTSKINNLPLSKVASPMRLHSFDSALRFHERIQKGLHLSSTHLSMLRSFHASGDYRSMIRDPVSNVTRTYSHALPLEAQKSSLLHSSTPTSVTSASHVAEGAWLLLSERGHNDIVIDVYDNDPASIISYALSSKEYDEWVTDKSNEIGGGWSFSDKEQRRFFFCFQLFALAVIWLS
ncbi:hypothetical protein V6N11_027495 [Hibiscus sabdariffa]|uniref:1-phosphatidylinositol-3-phosphate 5-kinase n=1 Tax=Hibiscus sabdariffa TaxID=183260 RepID=A0ABR2PH39_9ROSI